ncbi:response regulator [Pseudodesulfovibrio cashew]|uniref:Response regulator n=1 Tax=Pseudodesulfovibrio cashew TaxID=2678688 RepID=A0A6I6JH73_9BACT|nr:response regulator [Pseudodesulfovibrio cashew]QGY40370.1 response regulator [Pseudodesulfovibrio cashew]
MSEVRVLLVDDEPRFSAPLGKRLAKRGFAVGTVDSGQKALDLLETEGFDVVLLDIKMAGMDGINTLGKLKRRHPRVEVIMLTAHANTEMVISCLAMGACDYLLKPADMEELVRKIGEAVRRDNRKPADR